MMMSGEMVKTVMEIIWYGDSTRSSCNSKSSSTTMKSSAFLDWGKERDRDKENEWND